MSLSRDAPVLTESLTPGWSATRKFFLGGLIHFDESAILTCFLVNRPYRASEILTRCDLFGR